MEDEVSPVWLSNVRSLLPILSRWWSYPTIQPGLQPGPLWGRDPAPKTALMSEISCSLTPSFTCGSTRVLS